MKHYWAEGFQRKSFLSQFISCLLRRNKTPIFPLGDLTHVNFLVSHFALFGYAEAQVHNVEQGPALLEGRSMHKS